MAFNLKDSVRKIGQEGVFTVEEIRENPSTETMYWVQRGRDFATRVWAKESELELVIFEQEKFHVVETEGSIPNDLGEMTGQEICALIRTRAGMECARAMCLELREKDSASIPYKGSLGQNVRFDIRRTL